MVRVFAVWSGGLGIWGGVAAWAAAGIWRVRRAHADAARFADAVAPALLVAQAIGRIGNYFNQELFGRPTSLPWALAISPSHRPAGYGQYATFQPTFLYELIFDLALAAALVWLGHHRSIRPPGLFALYVTGYSAFRIFDETLRIDSSEHFLGLRLNFYIAAALTLAGIAWFVRSQCKGKRAAQDAALLATGAILAAAATGCGQAAHQAQAAPAQHSPAITTPPTRRHTPLTGLATPALREPREGAGMVDLSAAGEPAPRPLTSAYTALCAERLASSLPRRSPIVTATAVSWSLRAGTPNGRATIAIALRSVHLYR